MSRPLLGSLLALALAGCAAQRPAALAREAPPAVEGSPESLRARGLAFARVGDLTRAEQYLAAALAADAPPKDVLPKLLEVCIASHHYRAAIAYAGPELQRDPENASLRFVVAELEALTGDVASARRDLEQVTAGEPEEAAPHFAYGRLLRDDVGDPVAADREFRAYLRLEPGGAHEREAHASLLKVVSASGSPVSSPVEVQ